MIRLLPSLAVISTFIGFSIQDCYLGHDIAIVFDLSTNTTEGDLDNVWLFLEQIVDTVEEDRDTHMAMLSYHRGVRPRIYLDDLAGPETLRQARNIFGTVSDVSEVTHRGLLMLETKIFNGQSGDRTDKDNLAIIVTNRKTSDGLVTALRAERLKASGVTILVCAVGSDISAAELSTLASRQELIISTDTFHSLQDSAIRTVTDRVFACMHTVFVARAGSAQNVYDHWAASGAINENDPNAEDIFSSYGGFYKSSIIDEWDDIFVEKVKVTLYTNGIRKAYYIFDGASTDKFSWFTANRLISTSENGLIGAETNYFSIEGDDTINRHFFINSKYGDCSNDAGWLVVVDVGNVGCTWSQKAQTPYFLYSPSGGAIKWEYAPIAEVFTISMKYRRR